MVFCELLDVKAEFLREELFFPELEVAQEGQRLELVDHIRFIQDQALLLLPWLASRARAEYNLESPKHCQALG